MREDMVLGVAFQARAVRGRLIGVIQEDFTSWPPLSPCASLDQLGEGSKNVLELVLLAFTYLPVTTSWADVCTPSLLKATSPLS